MVKLKPKADDGCPVPAGTYSQIVLGHGSGGRLTANLLSEIFLPAFSNPVLDALEDQATVDLGSSRLAFTTDSFVVQPLFFPGGDIGRLAVCGTVNDLAVGGALPRLLSAGFILEEGLALSDLRRIVASMRAACDEAGVTLVAGDTKVVDRGKADGVFINTSGIAVVPEGRALSIHNARPGDQIMVSGTLGDHGMAIMSVREGLEFETTLQSDVAPLAGLTEVLLAACPTIRCMRDPTRGGAASALHEIASASHVGIRIHQTRLVIRPAVQAACEILGLDPLYVANEGKLLAVVPAEASDHVLRAARAHPLGTDASFVGEIVPDHPGIVTVRSSLGVERVLPLLTGQQLPRIC